MLVSLLVAIAFGYLLGSLPFGYLVARAKGVNIFEAGSRNPGATNVRRVLGPGPGNLVFALDALKGAGATGAPLLYFWLGHVAIQSVWTNDQGEVVRSIDGATACAVAGLIAALIGHSFSCFTRFRGGKGVATSVGGLVILMPVAAVIAALAWVLVFYTSRYVSLASICAALALVAAAWLLSLPALLLALSLIIAGFVIIRHRSNIVRLLQGTENRFGKKGGANPP
jgi:glycerol-3-phosphate acyltransferase PlsY